MNARNPEHLSALLSQPQGLSKQCEFSIDRAVGQASGLACRDIRGETRLIDRHQPLIVEPLPDRFEFDLYIPELPIPRDLVVLYEGLGDLSKPDALQSG